MLRMNYTTNTKNNSINEVYSQNNTNNNTIKLATFHRFQSLQRAKEETKDIVPVEPPPKKMKWGEPTWFLLHTLAYKIKDEYFQQLRVELLDIIYAICSNLPCPACANHAAEYLKSIHYTTIRTKQELINMLYKFHNEVNKKKGFAIFPYEELEPKYSSAVTKNIIFNFMLYFQDKNKNVHMIANDMFRAKQVVILKQWFNNNFKYFNP